MINNAYEKLLLINTNQSLPILTQYLCQLSNISECLPIEKQDRVKTNYLLALKIRSFFSISLF